MQRLTDIWRDLIRRPSDQVDEDRQGLIAGSQLSIEQTEELQEAYHNLYWTRLVTLQQQEAVDPQMHPIAEDVIEALSDLNQQDSDNEQTWQLLFDPKQLEDNMVLTDTQAFSLGQQKMREWGSRVTLIREKIAKRAAAE